MLKAHRAIESITLDREAGHLKDELMPRYASLIYNGYWYSPERKALQALIDQTRSGQRHGSFENSTKATSSWSAAAQTTACLTATLPRLKMMAVL